MHRRVAAAFAAPATLFAAAWTSLVAVVATSLLRVPDADPSLDGDPCCPYPDSWAAVAVGALGFFVLVALALALMASAATFATVAATGRTPAIVERHARWIPRLLGAAVVLVMAAGTLRDVALH